MAELYHPGDVAELEFELDAPNPADPEGPDIPTDADVLELHVEAPDGTVSVYLYGQSALITRTGTGRYEAALPLPSAGTWHYSFRATGAIPATARGTLNVAAPDVGPGGHTLVGRLREMTGAGYQEYAIGDTTYWTDEQLRRVLETTRSWHQGTVHSAITPAGTSRESRTGHLHLPGTPDPAGGRLYSGRGTDVAEGWTVDHTGHVDFGADLIGQRVYWEGFVFDLEEAAATVLEAWAAAVKLHYDVSTDGQSMSRSQKHRQLRELAQDFRRRRRAGTAPMVGGW
jgi:hypothetical protein